MNSGDGFRQQCRAIAQAILHDRAQRRKMMLQHLFGVVAMIALGVWVLDRWLSEHPLCFLIYWLGVTCAVLMLVLFTIYDMLRTYQEIHNEEK